MHVFTRQFDLHEQINRPPERVQQTRKREVEESKPEILRRRRGHEAFDRLVITLDLPPIAVLGEKSAPPIRHEHRVLPVIIVFRVLLPPVDQRCLVPFVLSEVESPVGLVPVLITSKQPLGLGFGAVLVGRKAARLVVEFMPPVPEVEN